MKMLPVILPSHGSVSLPRPLVSGAARAELTFGWMLPLQVDEGKCLTV